MKKLLLFLAIIGSISATGQTKKIAHRSHSGSNASFDADSEDDFGLPNDYREKRQKMDSAAKRKAAEKDSLSVKKDSLPVRKQPAVPAKSKAIRRTKKVAVSH